MAKPQAIQSRIQNAQSLEEKRRLARLWNYWNIHQDDFPKISIWPLYLQNMMLNLHKKSFERYRLFTFLVGNGRDPLLAIEDIKTKDFVRGCKICETYDADAVREFQRFWIRSLEDETFWARASYFDLLLNHVVKGGAVE